MMFYETPILKRNYVYNLSEQKLDNAIWALLLGIFLLK